MTPPALRVPDDVKDTRAAACAACPHRNQEKDRCPKMSCGCSLAQRQESRLGRCPLGSWGPAKLEKEGRRTAEHGAACATVCKACQHYKERVMTRPAMTITVGVCAQIKAPLHRLIADPTWTCPLKLWKDTP